MLAIGLEDKLPNFRIDLDRMDSVVDLVLETTRKAYPFVRRAVSFALAALRHQRGQSLGCRRRPDRVGPIARPAPGLNSIWPSSASSSMPAPVHRGATAIQRPDQPSAVRKDWDWPALPCSRAAHSRLHPLEPCASMPTRSRISPLPTSSAACRSRMLNPLVGMDGRADLLRRLGTAGGLETGNIRQPRLRRGPAACSIGLRCWQTAGSCPRQRF